MSDLIERLYKAEQYFIASANQITDPEALHAYCCHEAADRIEELENTLKWASGKLLDCGNDKAADHVLEIATEKSE